MRPTTVRQAGKKGRLWSSSSAPFATASQPSGFRARRLVSDVLLNRQCMRARVSVEKGESAITSLEVPLIAPHRSSVGGSRSPANAWVLISSIFLNPLLVDKTPNGATFVISRCLSPFLTAVTSRHYPLRHLSRDAEQIFKKPVRQMAKFSGAPSGARCESGVVVSQ
jgi:hypothetical protein